jgi:hypothetical protein
MVCFSKHIMGIEVLISSKLCSLFARLISHQPAVLFSQNKSATSNQPAVLFFQNKSAPAISHQPTEQVTCIMEIRQDHALQPETNFGLLAKNSVRDYRPKYKHKHNQKAVHR